MYKKLIRPILFSFEPEKAHKLTLSLLKLPISTSILKAISSKDKYNSTFEKRGFKVKNIIGLAAGLDKDGEIIKQLEAIGFGFIEVGTVTPEAQPGNKGKRLQRLVEEKALINRMGFNNEGAEKMKKRLEKYTKKKGTTIGINLGKNKKTPLEEAHKDYLKSFKILYDSGDYFVINVSSPNTPNLRELQEKTHLEKIIENLVKYNKNKSNKSIFVKIAPELDEKSIDSVIELVKKYNLTGIIATNTTINRKILSEKSQAEIKEFEQGGISGKPLREKSNEIIKYIRKKAGDDIVIIGVGGIFSCSDIKEKLEAGADVVQIYTSFIYEGPGIVKKLKKCIWS